MPKLWHPSGISVSGAVQSQSDQGFAVGTDATPVTSIWAQPAAGMVRSVINGCHTKRTSEVAKA